jgi:hypothetical protein
MKRLFVAAIWRSIVRGSHTMTTYMTYGDSVLARVPARVKNLLVEVQRVHLHGLTQRPAVLSCGALARRDCTLLNLERRLVRLQDNIGQVLRVVYAEVVVIRAREHMPVNEKALETGMRK